jgi:predicted outer membrane protein
MGNLTLLEAVAVLALFSCTTSATSSPVSSAALTSATVATSDLDDAQIASLARKMQADLGVLAALADRQGDALAVRSLARGFVEETSGDSLISAPTAHPRHPSALEDELAKRDVAIELRLADYGGRSFDEAFLRAEATILQENLELLERTLVPGASDPALQAGLVRLASLLSHQLDAVRAVSSAAGAP